jgi:hypothetical protein
MNISPIKIINERNIPFNVTIQKSVPCGGCDTVVKIYDARYENKRDRFGELVFGQYGQYVSSYYTKTILDIPDGNGLNMHGGIPDWALSSENVNEIRKFIQIQ